MHHIDRPSEDDSTLRRLRLELGITQTELAERANVTRLAVIRTEQLMPAAPPVGVVSSLREGLALIDEHYSEEQLEHLYSVDRQLMIDSNFSRLLMAQDYMAIVAHAINHAIDYYEPTKPPVKLFREYLFDHYGLPLSAIKFCRYTGLHPATLSEIETGKVDWPSTGLAFKEVLRRLELSKDQLAILGRAHDNYYLSI